MRQAINVNVHSEDRQTGNDSSTPVTSTTFDYIKIVILFVFIAVVLISAVKKILKSDW